MALPQQDVRRACLCHASRSPFERMVFSEVMDAVQLRWGRIFEALALRPEPVEEDES